MANGDAGLSRSTGMRCPLGENPVDRPGHAAVWTLSMGGLLAGTLSGLSLSCLVWTLSGTALWDDRWNFRCDNEKPVDMGQGHGVRLGGMRMA